MLQLQNTRCRNSISSGQ